MKMTFEQKLNQNKQDWLKLVSTMVNSGACICMNIISYHNKIQKLKEGIDNSKMTDPLAQLKDKMKNKHLKFELKPVSQTKVKSIMRKMKTSHITVTLLLSIYLRYQDYHRHGNVKRTVYISSGNHA